MEKSGYTVSESIVVENAPLGARSAKAAGLFTIALNTDPLDPFILREAGADLVFTGAQEFSENWPKILRILSK
jgi:beta-phosphoglucomutase-like phosphatase (HAD superfamily)